MADTIVELDHVSKVYNPGQAAEVEVLHDVSFSVHKGEFVALIGPSGSGKSTLLNIIGLLDRPTSGHVIVSNKDTTILNEDEITHLRAHSIGFVFQYHYLISAFTAIENVMLPLLADHVFPSAKIEQRAKSLIDQVGLSSVANNPAMNMSGGQQQRVAIARALAMDPEVVLADEPTGNLDTKSSDSVFALMRDVSKNNGTTFLFVTHNMSLAKRCDRVLEVVDGKVSAGTLKEL